jgi:hypothetical protein
VVNTPRTFDLAAAAGHAAIEYLGHFVNLVFGEITVSSQIASHPTRPEAIVAVAEDGRQSGEKGWRST